MALLLAVVAWRVTRHSPVAARAFVAVCGTGLCAGAGFWMQSLDAGVQFPVIGADSCSGSQTYTAVAGDGDGEGTIGGTPPPCFVNTCGAPVTVSYTFESGTDYRGGELTAVSCTKQYICYDQQQNQGVAQAAEDGAQIPSDGSAYGTVFCAELFDPNSPQGGEID